MKAADLRQLTDEELEAKVRELRDGLFDARVKFSTGQLEGTAGLRRARRDLARALTLRAERERK